MPTTTKALHSMTSLAGQDVAVCPVEATGIPRAQNEVTGGPRELKKFWRPLHHRIVWVIAGALLAVIAAPVIAGFVLKALGLIHGASLHTWLLDVSSNVNAGGASGALGAGASGASCSLGQGSDPSNADGPPSYLPTTLNNGSNSDGPQFKNDPYVADKPVGAPQDNRPVYRPFSGSVGERIEQAIDMFNAAKIAATGQGDQETRGTAAPPEAAE
jgi:hypothetical protein